MAKPPSHEKIESPAKPVVSIEESDRTLITLGSGAKADQNGSAPVPYVCALNSVFAERYKILEKVGEGGMSTVFKVEHIHLNKILALKVLHQLKEESILRFKQEAKTSSMLKHPNIVRVHDFGVASGLPYMTMDYLEGVSLSDFFKAKGTTSKETFTNIFGQICNALSHAHDQGVVHRDLKPTNIIVQRQEDGYEQAIIVDFGIAKVLPAKGDPDSKGNLTRTGDVFGTPIYMSPEQCKGQSVDARSDIYSLGCVMYETVAGNPPFQGNSVYETIHSQITEAPPPFSNAIRRTKSGRRLEAMILKAMAKLPDDRQQYIQEVSSDLKSIEIGDSNLWSELTSSLQILTGRIKAAERQSVITKSLLDCSLSLALIVSLSLLSQPNLISVARSEYVRNSDLVGRLEKITTKTNDYLNPDEKKEYTDLLNGTEPYCKGRQKAMFDSFRKGINNAIDYEIDIMMPRIRQMVADGVTVKLFKEAFAMGRKSNDLWNDARRTSHKLVAVAHEDIQESNRQLQFYKMTQLVSDVLAFLLSIILPILIWRRFRELKLSKTGSLNPQSASN